MLKKPLKFEAQLNAEINVGNAAQDVAPVEAPKTPAKATPKTKPKAASKKAPKTPAKTRKLETTSYKGVRDFYPRDMFIEKFLFERMRRTAESFGYVEYSASILEPAELYRAKTGEEIVNEQTYTFTDRGGREVTLRPEMTPTVARMIAAKRRELPFPLRWYSIPNLFRYEQPQRGRIREHFQFNVDMFGIENERAEIEIVSLAYQLMKDLGAKDEDFEIRVNDRNLLNYFWDSLAIPEAKRHALSKIIDKKQKIPADAFAAAIETEIGDKKAPKILAALESGRAFFETITGKKTDGSAGAEISKRLISVIDGLSKIGVTNVVFTPTLVRGLDYYSGFVFEIFDTNTENPRALFGGGRYDNLLEIFEAPTVPAMGFGAGDVTLADFLRTHNLLPEYRSTTLLYLAVLDKEYDFADIVAEKIRNTGVTVAVDYTEKSFGDRIKKAAADNIPFFAAIGSAEVKNLLIKTKKLADRTETEFTLDEKGIAALAKMIIDSYAASINK